MSTIDNNKQVVQKTSSHRSNTRPTALIALSLAVSLCSGCASLQQWHAPENQNATTAVPATQDGDPDSTAATITAVPDNASLVEAVTAKERPKSHAGLSPISLPTPPDTRGIDATQISPRHITQVQTGYNQSSTDNTQPVLLSAAPDTETAEEKSKEVRPTREDTPKTSATPRPETQKPSLPDSVQKVLTADTSTPVIQTKRATKTTLTEKHNSRPGTTKQSEGDVTPSADDLVLQEINNLPATAAGMPAPTLSNTISNSAKKHFSQNLKFGTWELQPNWDGKHPEDCRLVSPTSEVTGAGNTSQVWLSFEPDRILVNSSSDLKSSLKKAGLRFDSGSLMHLSKQDIPTQAAFNGRFSAPLSSGETLNVYLGPSDFEPAIQETSFALATHAEAIAAFNACNGY